MKKNKTKAAYEKHLNDLYGDAYSWSQVQDNFIYLTVKGRQGGHVSNKKLFTAYQNHQLGTLFRKHDSIAFEVGYNDWAR